LWALEVKFLSNRHRASSLGSGRTPPDRFSHNFIGLKELLVGRSLGTNTSPNAALRLCLVYDLASHGTLKA
jgi:hypothetical protein